MALDGTVAVTDSGDLGTRRHRTEDSDRPSSRLGGAKSVAIWLVAVLALVAYLAISIRRYLRYEAGIDLAIFNQAVKGYAQFEAPNLPLKAQLPFHALGDHFTPITALAAPFYHVFPDARTLLVVQAALLAAAVLLIGRFAAQRIGWSGIGVQAAFALSWGIVQTVAFDFHEVAFAVPLLVLAIWMAMERRWAWLAVWSIGLLLTKEDSAFLLVGIAIYLLTQRQVRAAIVLGLSSVAAFFVIIYVIIPFFSFYGEYTYSSNIENGLIDTAVMNLTGPKGALFVLLIMATCGLGLRSPLVLIALPTILVRLVSSNDVYLGQGHHYHATLVVIYFMALVEGCRWLRETSMSRPPKILLATAQALLLVGLTYHAATHNDLAKNAARDFDNCSRCTAIKEAVSRVPAGAYVVADAYATAPLSDRSEVGLAITEWKDSTGVPLEPEWVLLDENSSTYENESTGWVKDRVERLKNAGFQEVYRQGPIVLLHREAP